MIFLLIKGKTTTLSMLTRHLVPTSGDAFISSFSILGDFPLGATHLGYNIYNIIENI